MKPWPKDWPEYHNANADACDMAVGPCACGATHTEGEFSYIHEVLWRDHAPVAGNPVRINKILAAFSRVREKGCEGTCA